MVEPWEVRTFFKGHLATPLGMVAKGAVTNSQRWVGAEETAVEPGGTGLVRPRSKAASRRRGMGKCLPRCPVGGSLDGQR